MKNLILSAVPVGQSFLTSAVTAGVALEIISPQLNINGAIIRTLSVALSTVGAGGAGFVIVADITAPTSGTSNRVVLTVQNPNSSGPVSGTLPYPLYLYPGQGLWAFSSTAPADVCVTWDYLNPQ